MKQFDVLITNASIMPVSPMDDLRVEIGRQPGMEGDELGAWVNTQREFATSR